MQRKKWKLAHRYQVFVASKALDKLDFCRVPYGDPSVLPSARQVFPIRAQSQGKDFIRMAFKGSLLLLPFALWCPMFPQRCDALPRGQVPLDDRAVLACGEERPAIFRHDGLRHGKLVSA